MVSCLLQIFQSVQNHIYSRNGIYFLQVTQCYTGDFQWNWTKSTILLFKFIYVLNADEWLSVQSCTPIWFQWFLLPERYKIKIQSFLSLPLATTNQKISLSYQFSLYSLWRAVYELCACNITYRELIGFWLFCYSLRNKKNTWIVMFRR